uniref:Uncharacterized protein n=1 Tax=Coccidioides posadasii RMSCC 3488 TaxID=454284 RepID=A0A0J6F8P3_COCPO|nr:hypothetical protein CPAG_01971 [Coccidioides posadasii RMSCC 3488]
MIVKRDINGVAGVNLGYRRQLQLSGPKRNFFGQKLVMDSRSFKRAVVAKEKLGRSEDRIWIWTARTASRRGSLAEPAQAWKGRNKLKESKPYKERSVKSRLGISQKCQTRPEELSMFGTWWTEYIDCGSRD